jgi:hypothetical protein
MSADDPDPLADELISSMAAYDEALAQGAEAPLAALSEATALGPRWQQLQSFLRLLRENLAVAPTSSEAAFLSPLDRAFYPGESSGRFGRFLIRRELGRGGFGIVFLAEDPRLHRQVALKVPRPDALTNADLRQRFLREAQAAASLDHPNVVPVYEAGEVGPICYLVSAYCSGDNLAAWLLRQTAPPPPHCAAALVAALAEAVEHAHRHGIFHRDIKPSNILLVPRPAFDAAPSRHDLGFDAKLTDFGLAKLLEDGGEETTSGVLLGTPAYMAPEQAEGWGHAVGAATDIYALGLILYELLTLRRPFAEASLLLTLEQVRSGKPIPPRRWQPEVPRDLETICLKCLRKDPAQRYACAADLACDLHHVLCHEPIEARSPSLLTQAWDWCRRAERIRDAALVAIFQGSIAAVMSLSGLLLQMAGAYSVQRWGPTIGNHLLGIVVGCSIIWLGRLTSARHKLVLFAGCCLPVVYPCFVLAIMTGNVDSGGLVTFQERSMILAQVVSIFLLHAITIIAYVLALIAYYANRHRPGFVPKPQP